MKRLVFPGFAGDDENTAMGPEMIEFGRLKSAVISTACCPFDERGTRPLILITRLFPRVGEKQLGVH